MMLFKMSMRLQKLVIHHAKVKAAVANGTRHALMMSGALVRKIMRNSIRRRKASAPPGQPPSAHYTGTGGLKLILYAWDPATRSVPVGPIPFKDGEAPQLLEHGGSVVRRPWTHPGKPKAPRRRMHYRARPFAWPALLKARKEFPQYWRDAIRG